MIKLAKYLKPFIIGFITAIILLFVQAVCDLNLPNLMSDIVNTGIQQSGIEHAAPDVISPNGMKLIKTFMTEDEKTLADASYSYKASDENYPEAKDGVYLKNEVSKKVQKNLDEAFGGATVTLISVMRDMMAQTGQGAGAATGETTGETGENNISADISIDITRIYAAQPIIDALPAAVIGVARTKSASNDIMRSQSGILLTKAFYSELGVDLQAMQRDCILKLGGLMLLVALTGGIATVIVSFLSTRISTGVARNLRKAAFDKVESFSNGEFDRFSTASLITRCTNDVTQVQMLLTMGIRMICYAPIMGVGGIIMAVSKAISMSWIIAIAVIVLIGIILIVTALALPKFKAIQKLIDKINLVSRENLSGLMVIRAFGAQRYESERFDKVNTELTKTNLFVNRVMIFMMPLMMLIMNGLSLGIVWVGAHQIADSVIQIGDMLAFIQYAMQIIMSFLMISMMFIFVPRAAVSADRIAEVLAIDVKVKDPEKPVDFSAEKKGTIEFKDVHFRYYGAEIDAISNITFTAESGKTTAVIGPTGSGKSTLANLILRFYDVTEGQILIDGVDIRDVKQEDLRKKIGYVPQKGVLLSGTIDSNIRYGKADISTEQMENAAEIAQAKEFINERPDKFQSEIAQGGTNVSGGQKQRLSIARALAGNPEILIFDDSFSALDFKTDAMLRKALKEKTKDTTQIVIAQRVGTIMNADQIITLDKGMIVGIGTHRELLKNCPEYYEIASSQLSEEELA